MDRDVGWATPWGHKKNTRHLHTSVADPELQFFLLLSIMSKDFSFSKFILEIYFSIQAKTFDINSIKFLLLHWSPNTFIAGEIPGHILLQLNVLGRFRTGTSHLGLRSVVTTPFFSVSLLFESTLLIQRCSLHNLQISCRGSPFPRFYLSGLLSYSVSDTFGCLSDPATPGLSIAHSIRRTGLRFSEAVQVWPHSFFTLAWKL